MSEIVERLTGRTRFRTGWFGKLVLQVEVWQWAKYNAPSSFPVPHWRDATVADLAVDEGRALSRTNTPTPPPYDSNDAMYLPLVNAAAAITSNERVVQQESDSHE